MRSFAFILAALILIAPARAQQDISSKRALKEQAKIEKQRADEREWERQTEPPHPDHPASVRPEFQAAIRQAAGLIDNAFNTIPSSRIEFSIANQNAQQAVAIIKGSAQGDGEVQAIETLAAYAQVVPVCQQAAWDAATNIILLAVGNYGRCQSEARRRRAIAEKTLTRNSRPAPLEIPIGQPVSSTSEPDRILTVSPSKYGAVSVRFVSSHKQRIIVDVDSTGEKSEVYDVGDGASFVISRSLFLSSTAPDDLQLFIDETLVSTKGKSIQVLVKK